jgi:anthranilate synthase component 2
MAIAHKKFKIYGVQFHPESIASEHGHQIIKNFLDLI